MSRPPSPIDAARVFDLAPDGILATVDEQVVSANATAGALLGRSVSSLVGVPLDALLEKESLGRLRNRLRLLDDGWKLPETSRLTFVGEGDRRASTVDCRISRFEPESGGAGLVLGLRDATEAARAEELVARLAGMATERVGLSGVKAFLDASEPLLTALDWRAGLLDCRPDGVELVHLVAEPFPGHPVAEYGRQVMKLGILPWERVPVVRAVYEKGEAIFLDDVPTQLATLPGLASGFAGSMQAGGFTRGVWVPIRHQGAVSHVLIVVGSSLTEHDFAGIRLFGAQIGAALGLEALQNELVRRERLAAVGEMAAVLAHEVRNPLAVIFNAVTGMRRMAGEKEDVSSLLDVVHEEADRLKRVVRDLLDFARPVVPEIQPTPLAGVVSEALESVLLESPDVDVPVRIEVPATLPKVASDPYLLRRAIVNVLDNALRATPPGGSIVVRGLPNEPGRVRLQIHNDGEPIPPQIAERVFEPFFTNRATGTGLGLTVVRRIVEDLGGLVTLDPGDDGVSFSLWLPESRDDHLEAGTG